MLWAAILCGVACVVIGVPFTYYWLRFSDRWAAEDEKRFHPQSDSAKSQSVEDAQDIRIIREPSGDEP